MSYDLITGGPLKAQVLETIRAMYSKGYLPERSRKLIFDNINGLVSQYLIQVTKEFSCPICAITIKGPKFLLIQHQKVHADKANIKENENLSIKYQNYLK